MDNGIHLSRFLSDSERKVVDKSIQQNGYCGHPENVILNMMIDNRAHIRELAARKTKLARETAGSSGQIEMRKFSVPKLNFEAKDYYELVDWLNVPRLEPPIACKLDDNDIDKVIKTASMPCFEKYPCHTQAVQRHVKMVTDAAKSVCGKERREG